MKNNQFFFEIKKNIKVKEFTKNFELKKRKNIKLRLAIKFDKNHKVEGVISLGDLRRLILENKYEDKIYKFLNKNPYYLDSTITTKNIEKHEHTLKKVLKNRSDSILVQDSSKKLEKILNYDEIKNDYNLQSICIVGLGHVGLPFAMHLLKKADYLTGYDFNKKQIRNILNLKLNFYERGLQPLLKYNIEKNKFKLTSDIQSINSSVYIICLGSEIKGNNINNNKIINALKSLSKRIFPGNLILLRGTNQVGFTNSIAKKILEKESRMKCGHDFFLGYIPERLVEGNALEELEKLPQIVSGSTENCLNKSLKFCNNFFSKVIESKSIEESEIIKLSSNAFRDLSFAFSNEISRIANIYNLSGSELINKANLGYDRNNIAKPSMGVGGFCLPKDVHLFKKLLNKQKGYQLQISREVNNLSQIRVSKKIFKLHHKYLKKNDPVLILGITFKGMPENIDIRNSPSIELQNYLRSKNIKCYYYDVLQNSMDKKNNKDLRNYINIQDILKFKFIIFANNNLKYRDLFLNKISLNKSSTKNHKLVFDCWNMLDKNVCESSGYKYFNI